MVHTKTPNINSNTKLKLKVCYWTFKWANFLHRFPSHLAWCILSNSFCGSGWFPALSLEGNVRLAGSPRALGEDHVVVSALISCFCSINCCGGYGRWQHLVVSMVLPSLGLVGSSLMECGLCTVGVWVVQPVLVYLLVGQISNRV